MTSYRLKIADHEVSPVTKGAHTAMHQVRQKQPQKQFRSKYLFITEGLEADHNNMLERTGDI